MKRIIFLCLLIIVVTSCFSETKNPPIDKNLFIEYNNNKVILGYSDIDEVQKKLGIPEKSEDTNVSVEGFDWGKIKTLHYFKDKLILVFSETNNRLIQISFVPTENDTYRSFFNITNTTKKSSFLSYILKKKYEIIQPANSQVVWITYYTQNIPMFDVNCAIKFDDTGRISLIKYFFSAPWE